MEKLFEAQKGTILDEVNQIWLKGELVCPIETPVAEGEKVLREFSSYEKAIFMASHSRISQNCEILLSLSEDLDAEKAFDEISANEKISGVLNQLFWLSVRQELEKDGKKIVRIGLRENWQLVEVAEEEIDVNDDLYTYLKNFFDNSLIV